MVLSTLDLANPINEKLVNKYLSEGRWNELLIHMWNTYNSNSTLQPEEKAWIVSFISHCFAFIDNCIRYNIINVTVHTPLPCVEEPFDETPAYSVTPPLSTAPSEHSESPSIYYVGLTYLC